MTGEPVTIDAGTAAAFIFRLVEIQSPRHVVLDGHAVEVADDDAPRQGVAPAILQSIQDFAYERALTETIAVDGARSVTRLIADLSAAVASRERWDGGWKILDALASGQVLAEKGGVVRLVQPGAFATFAPPVAALSAGMTVSIFWPREAPSWMPGFYVAFGETPADYQDDLFVARFYWNVVPTWAPELFRRVTQRLNAFSIPFHIKCISDPSQYGRRDTAVLYSPRRMARFVADLLIEVHQAVLPGLREQVPLFTRKLAHGLAFAEDPGGPRSFGQHRAKLVALAIDAAYASGNQGEDERVAELRRQFADAQLDFARPYLNRARAEDGFPAFERPEA